MVKNITLSAEETLIRKARLRAKSYNKSLNEIFREWLMKYVSQDTGEDNYQKLMKELSHVRAGRKFTRDEYNER